MAERSTAAVGVAETSGENGEPLTVREDGATSDGATNGHGRSGETPAKAAGSPGPVSPGPVSPGKNGRARAAEATDPTEATDPPDAAEPGTEPESEAESAADSPAESTEPQENTDAAESTQGDESGTGDAASDTDTGSEATSGAGSDADADAGDPPVVPELHSGHKLARRYRLEECVTRLDGFSSWRAVDEKLRRAVGVHVLPAAHPRARQVLASARSAALLGDPRFVQVLDAVEEDDLVYVVHEWLPDATPLDELLAAGALEPHEAYQLVLQLSQALTAAHREGLAHLRLTPACVLRTGVGQYRIRGLAVNAALRGVKSDHAQRDDTEAIGALLYASLTQRWPYEEDAHGLPGVGTLAKGTLVAPDQVRAGVHRGLSTLAMRALVNDGATASRQEQPCATPEELSKAVSALPRIRPPETAFTAPAPYQRTAYQQGTYGAAGGQANGTAHPGGPANRAVAEQPAPPALPGRTGKVLKWGVSALLIAALGLGSWQVADALLKGEPPKEKPKAPAQANDSAPVGKPLKIVDAKDFDPESPDGSENPDKVPDAYDGDPQTYWLTSKYIGHATFGNLKSGAGIVLDLGKAQSVSKLKVDFIGKTSADFLAAPKNVTSMPSSLSQFSKVTSGNGEHLSLKAKKPIKTRYVLLWLTKLPLSDDGNYRGRVTEVQVVS
ncbi:protein kinase family protein [Streptomyces albiaxialis]|uniref:Protein kinase family protein n=1 Tax=Streptomyces albiaxialis TaxID=329523 RepID=A0ABN2W7I9_9ACTN